MRDQLRLLGEQLDELRAAPMLKKAQLADAALTRAYCLLALIVNHIEQERKKPHGEI